MVYLGIILAIIIIYILAKYNKLIKLKNKVKQSESVIDVYLNQRFDLIPNLVECVKGYANHEKSVIENVTKMRSEYMNINKSNNCTVSGACGKEDSTKNLSIRCISVTNDDKLSF